MTSPHQAVAPEGLIKPSGFSHVILPAPGRTLYLAGQTGHHPDGSLDRDLVSQFGRALDNLELALRSAGGRPEHVVAMTIHVTNVPGYRAELKAIGAHYRRVFGGHYPAMTLVGVSQLFDPAALVEVTCTAVIPS